jgi:hypothetical protein
MHAARWNLLRSLVEEVRDNTLSRSRMGEADQCLQFLDDIGARCKGSHHSAGNWLQHYIQAVFARKLCIEITCGTCGSTPFKSGLVQLASGGLHQDVGDVDQNALKEIASALAEIPSDAQLGDTLYDSDRAMMSVIYFLWSRSIWFEKEIEPILARSWAGQVLTRMQTHYATVQATRRIHAEINDPQRVQERRTRQKRERRDRHVDRLARKGERDRLRASFEGGK